MESHTRSIAKGITWRIIATITTATLVFIFSGNVTLSLQVGFFDIIIKLTLYYAHERTWLKIHWGRLHAKPLAAVYSNLR